MCRGSAYEARDVLGTGRCVARRMKWTQIWLKRLLGENALESFPRNAQGSHRLKRTVQTTIWERRHGTSRASNARLDSIPELEPGINMQVLVGGAGVPGTCAR